MVLGPSFLFGDSPPSEFSATIFLSIIAVEAIFESPLLDKKDSIELSFLILRALHARVLVPAIVLPIIAALLRKRKYPH
jgi:hypothetical protein